MLAAGAAVIATVAIIRTTADSDDEGVFHPPHEDAQMLRIVRAGRTRPQEDQALITRMTGDLELGSELVGVAFCVDGLDWLRDYTLDLHIAIATDAALIRAAELYDDAIAAGDLATASLIARAEQAYWGGDARLDGLRDWADDLADDDERDAARQYLDERRQPPSADARDRFVIYIVQGNMWEQRIFYLDTFRVSPAFLRQPASNPLPSEALVAGEDELRTLNLGDCDDVADDWDRYDPSLPELPPLDERWQLELDDTV